ncbi:MAG: type II toxin-antitoxin system HipA family toxin [Muribaculaceae bacterium]|nr:type II toxin-antitoxin system HipA family toxin [Muribaculaceae bacterium]
MKYLKVSLWGNELGRLVWNPAKRVTYFVFNPKQNNRPDVAPIMYPVGTWNESLPIYGDSRRIYHGLPPFIADSLPDSWGNRLFDKWAKQNHISRNQITPLFKLMFIGKRSMGALEFEPAALELEHHDKVDINSLYNLSLQILEEKENIEPGTLEEITMQSLIAVGTSAGGRQMKAIVAMNPITKEIRSGQINGLEGYEYYIIKFRDKDVPTTEVEMAFYDMAVASGINMEECMIITVEGIPHFMTRRFDRNDGEKVHMQTLAAINPEADSYEELLFTCRRLGLSDHEILEVYRRLVFNVLGNNTDDHNKNFSFLLEKGGKWRLSPAYDMTFIFNRYGSGPETSHCLSLYGKTDDISPEDLLDFAKEHNIRGASGIISKVAESLSSYPQIAEKYNIPNKWNHIIYKTLQENLIKFGFEKKTEKIEKLTDSKGRLFSNISISSNTKGYIEVHATIDGNPRKRVIKPNSEIYTSLQAFELNKLNKEESISLMEALF